MNQVQPRRGAVKRWSGKRQVDCNLQAQPLVYIPWRFKVGEDVIVTITRKVKVKGGTRK